MSLYQPGSPSSAVDERTPDHGERRPLHPYARRHLATHAAAGGVLNEAVLNLETLPYLDQPRLSTLLRLTEADPESPQWLLLSAWRAVRHRWSWEDPEANAAALDVAYLAAGGLVTPDRRPSTGLAWKPLWAEWQSGGTIVAGDARGPVRIAFGIVRGAALLVVMEPWRISFWDPATGQPVGEPILPEGGVQDVAVHGGEGLVVAVGWEPRILVWDAVTHLPRTGIDLPDGHLECVAVGDFEGRPIVAAGGTGPVQLTGLDGRGRRSFPPPAAVRALALTSLADGDALLAIGSALGFVEVLDVRTGGPAGPPLTLGADLNALALDQVDDRIVVAAGGKNGIVRVWDVRTGTELSEIPQLPADVHRIAIGRAGRTHLLATGSSDRTARTWYLPFGGPTAEPLPHPMDVTSVAFAEVEGRTMLATACEDGNTRLWDPIRPSAARIPAQSRLSSIAMDDEVVAAAGEDGTLRVWETKSGDHILDQPVPDLGGRTAQAAVWLGRFRGGRTLVRASFGQVEVWDLADPWQARILSELGTRGADVVGVDLRDDAVLLVMASEGSARIEVVDLATRQALGGTSLPETHRVGLVLTPKDALLGVQADGRLQLRDLWTLGTVVEFPDVHDFGPAAVGYVRGTPTLAVLGTHELRFLDMETGRPAGPTVPIASTSTGIAWARLGDLDVLLTAHFATVRVWHPRTGRKLTELPFGTRISSLAVHEAVDGSVLVAVAGPGAVVVALREVL